MTIMKLSDIIIPGSTNGVMLNGVIQRKSYVKSAFFASGIIQNNVATQVSADLDSTLDNGGKHIQMRSTLEPNDAEQIIDDTTDLTVDKLAQAYESTPVYIRAKAYGETDLAVDLGGTDPIEQLGDFWAGYWARRMQVLMINILGGALGASNAGGNVYDISGVTDPGKLLTASSFIMASQLLGDASDQIVAVAMHSAFYGQLLLQDLITFEPNSGQGKPIPKYLDKFVIVDDGLPYNSGTKIGTLYMFKKGSIVLKEGKMKTPIEVDRSSLVNGGQEWMVSRKKFIMHPVGFRFDPSATLAAPTPSNAEAATTGNWTRVYDTKEVGIVKFVAKASA